MAFKRKTPKDKSAKNLNLKGYKDILLELQGCIFTVNPAFFRVVNYA